MWHHFQAMLQVMDFHWNNVLTIKSLFSKAKQNGNAPYLTLYENIYLQYTIIPTLMWPIRPCHTRLRFHCVCTALLNLTKRREILKSDFLWHGDFTASSRSAHVNHVVVMGLPRLCNAFIRRFNWKLTAFRLRFYWVLCASTALSWRLHCSEIVMLRKSA
jgi:hypothetical protein